MYDMYYTYTFLVMYDMYYTYTFLVLYDMYYIYTFLVILTSREIIISYYILFFLYRFC